MKEFTSREEFFIMEPIRTYVKPEIQVVEILPEGISCASNEPVYEENGEW